MISVAKIKYSVNQFISITPYLIITFLISNIFMLAIGSIFTRAFSNSLYANITHIFLFIFTLYLFKPYLPLFKTKLNKYGIILFLFFLIPILIRFPLIYPTFDDLAFHFIAGDYSINTWSGGNFLPMSWGTYYYPVVDMLYTPFLHVVGIRFTIFLYYLLVSIWLISIYSRLYLLAQSKTAKLLLTVIFLVTPFIPHLIATHGTLMTDYISLVIILESLYLFLSPNKNKTFAVIVSIVAILAKQSTAIFIFPIYAYYYYLHRRNIQWMYILLFLFPALAYFVRLYIETGNPLFNLYNAYFKSSLYPINNFKDSHFGPTNLKESLSWPITGQFNAERFGQGYVAIYTKILFSPIYIIAFMSAIIMFIREKSLKYALILFSYIMWVYVSGYSRYYIPITVVVLIIILFDLKLKDTIINKLSPNFITILLVTIGILVLSSLKTDFSWRPFPSIASKSIQPYLRAFKGGYPYVFKDTIQNFASYQSVDFSDYEALVVIQRGNSTFYSYLGYLNGLVIVDAITNKVADNINNDNKISEKIKDNLVLEKYDNILLIVRDKYQHLNNEGLYIYKYFECVDIGNANSSPYLQESGANFSSINLYSCTKK